MDSRKEKLAKIAETMIYFMYKNVTLLDRSMWLMQLEHRSRDCVIYYCYLIVDEALILL